MDLRKEYLGWDDVEYLTDLMIKSMIESEWTPTVVVGLTRGGLAPATMISHFFNIPMSSLDVSFREEWGAFGGPTHTWVPEEIANGHRILVVDDINDSGKTFEWIRDDWQQTVQFLEKQSEGWPWNAIKFGALIHNEPSKQGTDFFGRKINKNIDPSWIVFPWESWYTRIQ